MTSFDDRTPTDTRSAVWEKLQSIERDVKTSLDYSIRGYEMAKRNTLGPGLAAMAFVLSVIAIMIACSGGLPK